VRGDRAALSAGPARAAADRHRADVCQRTDPSYGGLRIYFLQQWYALADEALEDALYDSQALRTFAGIDLSVEAVPDATTLLKFRHLLEAHALTERLFAEVGALLSERQLLMKEGTIVDATIIAAPSSTKNARKERDPEMHQTKKGHQWYFGMKAHIGVDAQSGLIHSVTGTAANVADIAQTHTLLHGQEKQAYADAGYLGVEKREEIVAGHADIAWQVAAKRGKIKAMAEGVAKETARQVERLKAQVRARVEHPFHVLKNLFRHRKTRYRGLAKNTAQLHSLFALVNLFLARRALLLTAGM
jgi:transposase, IS5 family